MSSSTITSGGQERLPETIKLYVQAFATDPVITYMLCSMPTKAARMEYYPAYFKVLLKAAALNKASFYEIGNYEAAAVLMPPGTRIDNTWTLLPAGFIGCLWKLGIGGCKRMLLEFEPKTDAAKAKALQKGDKYYYLFFIATREDCRGRGLASELIRHHQDLARAAKLPIWLEATTAHSRDIYAKQGFKLIEEIVLGEGTAAVDGTAKKGGEGVRIWGMIWRPETSKAEVT